MSGELFSSIFFAGNREQLRTETGDGLIVVTGNSVLQKSGDATFELAQDGSFWYLTGVDEPDVVLVMDGAGEYLIVPGRDKTMEMFDGRIDPAALTKISGVGEVLDEKVGWDKLKTRLKQTKKVATLGALPARVEPHGFYANPARARLIRRLKAARPGIELTDIRLPLARLRAVKQPLELTAIEAAINLTAEALTQAKESVATFGHEYELAAAIDYHFGKVGAESAWRPVVASGSHTCQMHYNAGRDRLKNGELVVVDIGARVDNYTADMARTWAIGGQPTPRQQAVHTAVLATQQFAFTQLKPGVLLKDYEQAVKQFLGQQLRALGLANAIDKDVLRRFCPHLISHFLGIDPHDAGDYDQPLEPGMVLAVEPGIYIPKEGLGVRIEDDVVITASGCRVLGRRLPSGL